MSYDTSNIFAKIILGEVPCNKIYEDEHLLAFEDIKKAAPVHILLIPKGQYKSFNDFASLAESDVINHFFKTAQKIASQLGLEDGGYRLVTNHGADSMQTVHHFHLHIIGGAPLGEFAAGI
jgi:diadenosine tetraphosphate (Ap4A) HIT family hydrolase